MAGCGCGGGSSSTASGGGAVGSGTLLTGTLDSRFASDLGALPAFPADASAQTQTAQASVAGDSFSLASLAAFPGGKWAALFFLGVAAYTIYASAKKSES